MRSQLFQQLSITAILFGKNKSAFKIVDWLLITFCTHHFSKTCKKLLDNCDNKQSIGSELKRMLQEGINEPDTSPWRVQVLIIATENHKKRMIIDYSQTINRFTFLDSFPLLRIDEMLWEIAKYIRSILKSAYRQVTIKPEGTLYTDWSGWLVVPLLKNTVWGN